MKLALILSYAAIIFCFSNHAYAQAVTNQNLLAGDFLTQASKAGKPYHASIIEGLDKLTNADMATAPQPFLSRILSLGLLSRLGNANLPESMHQTDYKKLAMQQLQMALAGKIEVQNDIERAQLALGIAIGYDWLRASYSPEQQKFIRSILYENHLKRWHLALNSAAAKQSVADWIDQGSMKNSWINAAIILSYTATKNHFTGSEAALKSSYSEAFQLSALNQSADANKKLAEASLLRFYELTGEQGGWKGATGDLYEQLTLLAMSLSAIDAEERAKTDWSKLQRQSLVNLAQFTVDSHGISGQSLDFGDSQTFYSPVAALFWLAKAYTQPLFQESEIQRIFYQYSEDSSALGEQRALSIDPDNGWAWVLTYLWLPEMDALLEKKIFRRAAAYPESRMIIVKGETLYFAIKGQHEENLPGLHDDAGSFVFEADGIRWATDLGGDDPILPAYQASGRRYFRQSVTAHNTIFIADAAPSQQLSTRMHTLQRPTKDQKNISLLSVLQLDDLYQTAAPKLSLSRAAMATIGESRHVMISDTISTEDASSTAKQVFSQFYTSAQLSRVEGASLYLEQNGKQLRVLLMHKEAVANESMMVPATSIAPATITIGDEEVPAYRRDIQHLSALRLITDKGNYQFQFALIPESSTLFSMKDADATQTILDLNGHFLNCMALNTTNMDPCKNL